MTMFPKIEGIYALLDDCPIRCAVHEFRESLYVNTGPLIRLLTPQDDGAFHDDDGRRWTVVGPLPRPQPASTAQEVEAEPVAWRYKLENWGPEYWQYFTKEPRHKEPGEVWQPLYTAPSSAVSCNQTLQTYDAGLLNDFGGGDVSWWQDYIRAELERAHEFYASQVADLSTQPASTALVERLRVAIHNALIDGPALANDGQSEFDRAVETILSGVQSALSSSSTSREGESRG